MKPNYMKKFYIDTERGEIWLCKKYIGGRKHELIDVDPPKRAEKRTPNGYAHIELWYNGKRHNMQVHRLVWLIAHGTLWSDVVIHHINRNKLDNRIANLEQMTHGEHISKKTHPRKSWVKELSKEEFRVWHEKTVRTRRENHLNRIKHTVYLKDRYKLTDEQLAFSLDVSRRTIQYHLHDFREMRKESDAQCP